VVVQFPGPLTREAAQAAVDSLGLSVISGDAATGRYVMALPQADIEPGPNHTAIIYFPDVATAAEINSYIARNHLIVISRSSGLHGREGGRFAVVQLPSLEPRLIDAYNGYYSLVLPTTDQKAIASWAEASGVRIIRYDAGTGETIVQPIGWRPPVVRKLIDPAQELAKLLQAHGVTPAPVTTPPPPPATPPAVTTPPLPALPAPTLAATTVNGHVRLTWSAVTGATSYEVYRSQAGGQPVLIGTSTGTTIDDPGSAAGATYT
jgi:hypothetical protein